MKRGTILLLSVIVSSQLTFGQIPPNLIQIPATRLETWAAKKGTLLATESYYLPGISGENCSIRLQAVIMYEESGETPKARGLKVEIENAANKNELGMVSYIDIEELEGLSKAIGSMLDMTRKGTALANPVARQLSFSTVGGLTLTMDQRERERELLLTHPFLTNSVCVVKRETAIVELKTSIDKALLGFRQP